MDASRRGRLRLRLGPALAGIAMLAGPAAAIGSEARPPSSEAPPSSAAAPPSAAAEPARPNRPRTIEITEYRIEGVTGLSQLELEAAVYPYLGPDRTLEDVERARVAIEKAYSDKGYQTVSVSIPRQTVRGGVVTLKASETTVGRLRVHGAHWFSLSEIKRQAPSVAEGSLPNFNDIVRDIYALNQIPDRRVAPALRAGVLPGTVDVDLNVQDRMPLHGAVEFNNRSSANTTPTRLDSSLRYDNLWQQGHSLALSLQVAPGRLRDATVFSASYMWRLPDVPWFSFSLNGVLQNSDISTLGSLAVQGRGRIFGAHASFILPGTASFFHTVGTGFDYKHFGKELLTDANAAPITYWPLTAQYAATFTGESSQTLGTLSAVANVRALSSGPDQFDAKRFKASGSFIYWRAEISRTEELKRGAQLVARLHAQVTTGPLIPSEQLTAGGVESVRGYLEAQAAGDYGAFGTLEVRSPSLTAGSWLNDFRLLAFADGGRLAIRDHLPEQEWVFFLWSAGGGARLRLLDRMSGSFDLGVPLRSEGSTRRYHPRLQFRLGAEF